MAEATAFIRALMKNRKVRHISIVSAILILLVVGSDCREREKKPGRRSRIDGGMAQRPECSEPYYNCDHDCYVRNASPACTRCCLDQGYVCDDGGKADFDSCKGSR